MKKLVLVGFILISAQLFGQSNQSTNYSLTARIGKSIPIHGSYLKNNWGGGPYICLDFIKKSDPIDFIVGCDFEYLSLADDKIQFITPHFGILHNFKHGKFNLAPSINIGYTWLNYTYGKGVISVPEIPVKEYHQNGLSASLDLSLTYDITNKLQIGIGDSYLNIFESFGVSEPKPDNSKFIGLNRPYISVTLKM
jgi:hypothetical protein